jgi:cytochrome c-type biogenesis protein CcmE
MTEMDLSPRAEIDPAAPPKRKRNIVPILVLALVIVAGGVIVTQFLNTAVDYFCNVDEVGVRDGCEEDRRVRLQGTVDEGTVVQTSGLTTFTMTYNDSTIAVEYDGIPGGIFRECIPVVVHGEIENGVLHGDNIEVKHSDEYVAENSDYAEAQDAGCASA